MPVPVRSGTMKERTPTEASRHEALVNPKRYGYPEMVPATLRNALDFQGEVNAPTTLKLPFPGRTGAPSPACRLDVSRLTIDRRMDPPVALLDGPSLL